jgi:hypothetical protein
MSSISYAATRSICSVSQCSINYCIRQVQQAGTVYAAVVVVYRNERNTAGLFSLVRTVYDTPSTVESTELDHRRLHFGTFPHFILHHPRLYKMMCV